MELDPIAALITQNIFSVSLMTSITPIMTSSKTHKESSIIVWDNASIHISEEIKRYLKENKNLKVAISSFLSWLNAAEN